MSSKPALMNVPQTVAHPPTGHTVRGLLSLMRPVNAGIAGTTVVVAGLIAGGSADQIPVLVLAGFAALLLGASGNTLNDVYDVEIDRINKPSRALAAGIVTRRTAIIWAVSCAISGLLMSWFVGTAVFAIAVFAAVLMYYYSSLFKHIPLLGNIVVGVVTGSAFLFGGYAVGNPAAGIVPALFACVFNMAREILKDVEDMEGDKVGRVRTFPLQYGVEPALTVTSVLFGLIIAGSVFPFLFNYYNLTYLVLVVGGVDLVLLAIGIVMWRHPTTSTISRLCTVMKYDMIVGIAAIWLGTH